MNTSDQLQTFRLWLEPDKDVPRFLRLRWEKVGVSIQDVLLHGIHPWMGDEAHYSLPEALLQRLNEPDAKIAEFLECGYCGDVSVGYGYGWEKQARLERALERVREDVCFVENLTYMELLEIAKSNLRTVWRHETVKEMARAACPGFQELRTFLKEKDKALKLSSYEDVDQYDLSKVLTLDDFVHKDQLVIHHGIATLNFRSSSMLKSITDEHGRLRLIPEIRDVTLTEAPGNRDSIHLTWHVTRKGNLLCFRPDIGDSRPKRARAMMFAKYWRTDYGQLCFHTTLDRLTEMMVQGVVMPSFPSLNYSHPQKEPVATATVDASRVRTYHIGRFADQRKATGDTLKEILRQYEVSMTGNKDQLIEKLAVLAGKKYREKLPEMDAFFTNVRVVRVQSDPTGSADFSVLENVPYLRNLLLTMYAMKHLRGGAVLEPSHENTAYTEDELALALLTGKVALAGAFLRVA